MVQHQHAEEGTGLPGPAPVLAQQHAAPLSAEGTADRQVTPPVENTADEAQDYPQAPVKRQRTGPIESSQATNTHSLLQAASTPTKSTPYLLQIIKSLQAMHSHKTDISEAPGSHHVQPPVHDPAQSTSTAMQETGPSTAAATTQITPPAQAALHKTAQHEMVTPAAPLKGSCRQQPEETPIHHQQALPTEPSTSGATARYPTAAWATGPCCQQPETHTNVRAIAAPHARPELSSPVWSPGARKRLRFDAGLDDTQADGQHA